MRRGIAIIACLLWMGFIFYQSSKTSQQSNKMSYEIVEYIEQFQKQENKIENVEVSMNEDSEFDFVKVNVFIRKSAHFFEFFILAILLRWVLIEYQVVGWKLVSYTLLGVLLYAMSDEFHQLFIEGRSARFLDIMVDFMGGATALLSIQFVFYLKQLGVNKLFYSIN